MTCLYPNVAAWYRPEYADTRPGGLERPWFFGPYKGPADYLAIARHHIPSLALPYLEQYLMPCGHCKGCICDRAMQWCFRCQCEFEKHEFNTFLTLTVEDECIDKVFPGKKLQHVEFQLFMKRLRKFLGPTRIKYLMCGEYGTHTYRPHYHAIIFGWWPSDAQLFKWCGSYGVYVSFALSELWKYGFHTVSPANLATSKYLVGYALKKIDYKYPKDAPPYLRVSNGIGLDWFRRYKDEIFAHGDDLQFCNSFVYCGNSIQGIPRYYIRKYKELADNVDYVSLMQSRLDWIKSLPSPEMCDLERERDYMEQVTKASHNYRIGEV